MGDDKGILKNIPKNNIICRRTDNNGRIKQNEENKEWIGKWTIGNKICEGNGKQLEQICMGEDLVSM